MPIVQHQIYANRRHHPLYFDVGDWVFLRVSSLKGVMRFDKQGKINPWYIGPFEILRRVGAIEHALALFLAFLAIDLVFYVLMLCRYVSDESHVLQYDSVELDDRLTFVDEPVVILAKDIKQLL